MKEDINLLDDTYFKHPQDGQCDGTALRTIACKAGTPYGSASSRMAALLLIQCPADVSGKAAKDAPSPWALDTHGGDRV